mmetsp:Transcript_20529/g.51835  ORF Transcript_20529/g.51835 Transcript_20529/m.51835 type:complete len:266 (-) Transcript_20529:252-1049(-)
MPPPRTPGSGKRSACPRCRRMEAPGTAAAVADPAAPAVERPDSMPRAGRCCKGSFPSPDRKGSPVARRRGFAIAAALPAAAAAGVARMDLDSVPGSAVAVALLRSAAPRTEDFAALPAGTGSAGPGYWADSSAPHKQVVAAAAAWAVRTDFGAAAVPVAVAVAHPRRGASAAALRTGSAAGPLRRGSGSAVPEVPGCTPAAAARTGPRAVAAAFGHTDSVGPAGEALRTTAAGTRATTAASRCSESARIPGLGFAHTHQDSPDSR